MFPIIIPTITPTPIIVPRPYIQSGGSGGNDDENDDRSLFWRIFSPSHVFGVLVPSVIIFMILLFSDMFSNGKVSVFLFVRSDKNYIIPGGFALRHNEANGYYVIQKGGSDYDFLEYSKLGGFNWWMIQDATHFNDSAKAKGALKKYLQDTIVK